MSHYGPKWQVISNLSLTPVWTRIREPSMKADTPIFEFVICNGRGGGEQFIMGCSRSCETFQPIMDTYSSIRWSEKFVKNRERKEFLIIDLWSHIYKYRVGIKLSFNFREKYTHIFFFKSKCDLSHVRSSPFSICQECRFRGFPPLLPPRSARTLKQPRAHDQVDMKRPEEEIENIERVHERTGGCTNTGKGRGMEWERSVKPEKLLTATMASSDFKKILRRFTITFTPLHGTPAPV